MEVKPSGWKIEPFESLLFVGSCFAQSVGQRFKEELFSATVNPYGVMYNPVSVLHTVQKWEGKPAFAILSLGTNHVYVDKKEGVVVDNCQKRPASDFWEKELSVEECFSALKTAVEKLGCRVIVTVSPIRYKKYGFHNSQLSKATLLLATERLKEAFPDQVEYFPSYEIITDELRDYRFYEADMLHPNAQAVEYVFQSFVETYFSAGAKEFLSKWEPIKKALAHRPIKPESEEYKAFVEKARSAYEDLQKKYPNMPKLNI